MAEKEKNFDIRIVERNISEGIVSAGDYKKTLKGLKDSNNNAEFVPFEEEENEQETPEKSE